MNSCEVAEACRQAVLVERERCARIVEQTRHYHHEIQLVQDAARRIRDPETEVLP